MKNWFTAARIDDVKSESVLQLEIGGCDIALYRCGDDFYATDNVCTHAHALLSDGFLDGFEIECPLHGARFDCRTGESLTGPADEDITTFPIRIVDGVVEVEIDIHELSERDAEPRAKRRHL